MSDPVETTQQAQQAADQVAAITGGGILTAGAILAGIHRLYVAVFGTRAEREAAKLAAAQQHAADERADDNALERGAELALRVAARSDEQTQRTQAELGTCQEQLSVMRAEQAVDRARIAALEEETLRCARESAAMRRELELMRAALDGALDGLLRGDTTPPPRDMPTPAAVAARKETTPR